MVGLNKRIKDVIKEIIYLISLILFSYLIWNNFRTNMWAQIAHTYNKKTGNLTLSKSMNDLSDNNTFIKIENNNDTSKDYIVYLSLKTEEISRIKNSCVTINTKETQLNNIDNFTDNSNTYYKIIADNINAREENSYFISLNTPLKYNIELKETK